MANCSLNQFAHQKQPAYKTSSKCSEPPSTEITDYLDQQVLILEYLKKAKAKAQIALSDDFLDYELETIQHYLGSLYDRLEITTCMFQDLIDSFFKIKGSLIY